LKKTLQEIRCKKNARLLDLQGFQNLVGLHYQITLSKNLAGNPMSKNFRLLDLQGFQNLVGLHYQITLSKNLQGLKKTLQEIKLL
jgi:hypothetical protein